MEVALKIELPWPADALHPNARPHWAKKCCAVKRARGDAKLAATAAIRTTKWTTCRAAAVQAVFYSPVSRRRDGDNFNAACKAYLDGLADAGVVENDSGFRQEPARFEKGEKRVELFVVRIEER